MGALILATLTYLLTELAFNAYLLDVAGGVSDIHDIEKVEHIGRIISGVAAALAVCGSFIFPVLARKGASMGKYLAASAIIGGPIIIGVYQGEKKLVDMLVAKSTVEERRTAAILSVAAHQLRRDGLEIRGIDLGEDVLATPEGKAFVALFATVVFQLPEVEKVVDRQLDVIVRRVVADSLGTLDGFYDTAYATPLKGLEAKFHAYADAADKYGAAKDRYGSKAHKAWADYEASLKKHGMTPQTVKGHYYERVRREVRASGVPVPRDWSPRDRDGFYAAFRDAYQREMNSKLDRGMQEAGLTRGELPLTLKTFDQFVTHPAIQKRWKDQIGFEVSATLKNGMSKDAFDKGVFQPLVTQIARGKIADLQADAVHFEEGGRLWTLGEESMRSVIVPPLALGLSMLGAIVHLCKVMLYSLKMILPYSRVWMISMAVFGVLAVAPFGATNAITKTNTYLNVERAALDSGRITPYLYRWVVQSQAYAYPINDWVRENITRGLFRRNP